MTQPTTTACAERLQTQSHDETPQILRLGMIGGGVQSFIGQVHRAAAQMDALVKLLQEIKARWAIRSERVIGHADMAPGRKIDPGRRFDWRRLALEGVAVWPSPEADTLAVDPAGFLTAMAGFGYTASDDAALLLDTFRMRFRPRHEGPLDETDMAIDRRASCRERG